MEIHIQTHEILNEGIEFLSATVSGGLIWTKELSLSLIEGIQSSIRSEYNIPTHSIPEIIAFRELIADFAPESELSETEDGTQSQALVCAPHSNNLVVLENALGVSSSTCPPSYHYNLSLILDEDLPMWRGYQYKDGDTPINTSETLLELYDSLEFDRFGAITNIQSPNFGVRSEGEDPALIVLHHTVAPLASSINTLTSTESGVSSDYLVSRSGIVYSLIDHNIPDGSGESTHYGWHSGYGSWKDYGKPDHNLNHYSIGIEIVDPDPDHQLFTLEQEYNVAALCKALQEDLHLCIPKENVISHGAADYKRKHDPSYTFEWEVLRDQGVIEMPAISCDSTVVFEFNPAHLRSDDAVETLRKQLTEVGYSIEYYDTTEQNCTFDHALATACWQFKAQYEGRFHPEQCNSLYDPGDLSKFDFDLNWYQSSQTALEEYLKILHGAI